MADPSSLPEPDAAEGAPHPRLAARLFGHEAAQAEFLAALASGRMHHGWLLSGPRGIGKATFAWKAAACLLGAGAQPAAALPGLDAAPERMDAPPDSPLRGRLAALSEPRLLLLRRIPTEKGDQLETQITVRALARLRGFFQLSAADGGRRVVIVDCADEMNPSAANALLKLLEEPPAGAVFLLVAHQPQRLLPTIRSRCRSLRLGPLPPEALAAALAQAGQTLPGDGALAGLAEGSAGMAVRLMNLDGLALWRGLVALMAGAPGLERPAALRLSEGFAGRANEARLDLLITLIELMLARLAHAGLGLHPRDAPTGAPAEEAALWARLSPDARAAQGWALAAQELSARLRHGKAVNLDPASLILDTLLRIDEAAAGLALPASA